MLNYQTLWLGDSVRNHQDINYEQNSFPLGVTSDKISYLKRDWGKCKEINNINEDSLKIKKETEVYFLFILSTDPLIFSSWV